MLSASVAVSGLLQRRQDGGPFADLLERLSSAVYPTPGDDFEVRLRALCAVLSFALLCSLVHAALVVTDLRRRRDHGSLWLAKTVTTSNGRFIITNSRVLSCLFSILNLSLCLAASIYSGHILFEHESFKALGTFRALMPVFIIIHLIILSFGPLQAFLIDPAHASSVSSSNGGTKRSWRRLQVADLLNVGLVALLSLGTVTLAPACVLTFYIAHSYDVYVDASESLQRLGRVIDPARPSDSSVLVQLLQTGQKVQHLKDKTYATYIAEFVPLCVLCVLLAVVNACSLWTVRRATKTAEQRVRLFPDRLEEQVVIKSPASAFKQPTTVDLANSGEAPSSKHLSANKLEPTRSEAGSVLSTSASSTDTSVTSVHDRTLMVDITKLSKRQLNAIAGKAEHGLQGEKARQLLALYAEGRELTLVASLLLALSLLGFGLATWFLTLVTMSADVDWPWSTHEAIYTVIQWAYGSSLLVAYPWLIYGTWCNLPESPNKIVWPSKCILRRTVLAVHRRYILWRARRNGDGDLDPELARACPSTPSVYHSPGRTRRGSVGTPFSARRAPYSPTAQGAAPSGRVRVVIQETVTEEYRLDALVSNSADVSPFFVRSTEQPATSAETVQPRSIETVIQGGFAQAGCPEGQEDEVERTLGCGGGLGIGVEWNKPSWAMLDADLGTSMAPPSASARGYTFAVPSFASTTIPAPTIPARARLSASPSRGSRLSVDSLATVATAATTVGLPKITSAIGGAIPWEWQQRSPPAAGRPIAKPGKNSASSLPSTSSASPEVLPRSSSA
ncbi:hypothetical protein ACM66B_004236 [Microbotryomycetes sp. NB124-2]